MARPVNADAAATRQRILDVAAELLQTTTPAQFSNREVARRADVSVATVNHHFGSKQKLIEAPAGGFPLMIYFHGSGGDTATSRTCGRCGTPSARACSSSGSISRRCAR